MVEQQVITALTAQEGSPAEYVTSAEDRVYALVLPQGMDRPAITFQRISNDPVNNLSGSSGLDRVRMQVDAWAPTYGEAKILAGEIRPLMRAAGFKGLLELDRDEYEPETQLYRVSSDYMLWQY